MNEVPSADTVRIHIDREPYQSANPTTGEALYALANIPKHHELFREKEGNDEDELVARDGSEVHLKPDEHFYSEKFFKIFVEGTAHDWAKDHITYAEVVTLEVPDYPQHPDSTYSVKFKNGPSKRPEGTLAKGESVKVKNGMEFSVSETGQS